MISSEEISYPEIEDSSQQLGSEFYKKPGTKKSQTDRREEFLIKLKDQRNDIIDLKRGILDILENNEESENIEDGEEPMEVSYHHKKRRKSFGHKLMLSEYLREKPDDLEHKWCFKLCPKGHRNLVVASNGTTKAFSRVGKFQAQFKSLLPGGNSRSGSKFTLLDCIWNTNTSTYYVLDILVWNSHSVIKCSSAFRFFFLNSKFEETPEISSISDQNKHIFIKVDYKPAELNLLEFALSRPYELQEFNISLDGVLFYHVDMIYKAGITPLVGWVKPYKISEIFEIPVHDTFMSKPSNCDNAMIVV